MACRSQQSRSIIRLVYLLLALEENECLHARNALLRGVPHAYFSAFVVSSPADALYGMADTEYMSTLMLRFDNFSKVVKSL